MYVKKYFIFTFILLITLTCSCTFVGLGLGINAGIDEELYTSESNNFFQIDTNTSITVITFLNDTIRGDFLGLERMPLKKYEPLYKLKYDVLTDSIVVPKIGDLVSVERVRTVYIGRKKHHETIKEKEKIFFGFDLHGILLGNRVYNDAKISPTNSIMNMTIIDGDNININKISSLTRSGKLPLATSLKVKDDAGEKVILGENIKEIIIEYSDGYWLLGIAAGFAIDAIIFASTFELDLSFGPKPVK